MAEGAAPEVVDPNITTVATVDMDVENVVESKEKRAREDEESKDDVVLKKIKVDEEKSVEEQRLEKLEKQQDKTVEEEEKEPSGAINLGPKHFCSSLEMFHYFHNFLHAWPQNLNVNKVFRQFLLFFSCLIRFDCLDFSICFFVPCSIMICIF